MKDELPIPYTEEEVKFSSRNKSVNEWLRKYPEATLKEQIAFEEGYDKGAEDWGE